MQSAWFWPLYLATDPSRLFNNLRDKWPWVPAYVVGVICNAVGLGLTLTAIEQNLEQVFTPLGIEWGSSATKSAILIGLVLGAIVSPLIVAFAYSFTAAFLGVFFRKVVDYGKLYSLTIWCLLPGLTVGSLTRGLLYLVNPALYPHFTLSPAALLPSGMATSALYAFLSTLDVFQVLFYMLFAFGYSRVTKLPVTKSAWISMCLYGLQVGVVFAFR